MNIKAIVIEGVAGDVEITRTASGVMAVCNHEVIAEMGRDDDATDRYAKAELVAVAVYGKTRRGPKATNSMVHEVLGEMERLAGC